MEKRSSFKGSIGFVLAAAGSAVGLGNIWRFPYLAANGGGGVFLFVYFILAFTFGFTLLLTEVAIGRKTKNSPLTAYSKIKKGFKPLGILGCLVPVIIMPYYCAIGGWVIKYFTVYVTGNGKAAANETYFTDFTSSTVQPIVFLVIFLAICAFIVFKGVNKGIESMSKIVMPALIILVIIISGFSLTIKHPDAKGVTRTGLDGLKVYLIPDFSGMTVKSFASVFTNAMCQLFFSLSIAMGIMVAYGSYVSDEANLVKSVNQIEIFDTLIAFLAGIMIIPALYVYKGDAGLESSGAGLMFIVLPEVFESMGTIGAVVGFLFFAMVLFAAVTSAVSIMEAVVSSIMDQFKVTRIKAAVIEAIIALVAGVLVCLGFNRLDDITLKLNGKEENILGILDYFSNNILMPIVAIGTCILIGWIVKPKTVIEEAEKNGETLGRKKLYVVMIKFIAPILLLVILLRSAGIINI